jgi:GTPase SAR1 family protein
MNNQPEVGLSTRHTLTSHGVVNPLARRIAQFNAWKKSLANEITRYSLWIHSRDRDAMRQQRLQHAMRLFATDRLRLVIAGEFSRGKTELINALLGRHAHMRLFPTRVGRTTMCPVELFCDDQASPYLKLLPIDTRSSQEPLQYFRRQPDAWFQLDLNANDPDSMRQIFREVARTREVRAEDAQSLGFDLDFLEASVSQPGYVHIPAWRHALINFDHPLLKLGLSIVDTPGINAPGVEADLTGDVMPDAQGILYLLSVETGVTASDFAHWNNKVMPVAKAHNIALFAILNKIDLLESDEEPIVESVERLIRMTAHQLTLPKSHVLPLSAKHGLKAAIAGDPVRLRRSGFAHLEEHLIKSVIETREQLLENDVLMPIIEDVKADSDRLEEEYRLLQAERTQFENNQDGLNEDYIRAQRAITEDQQALNRRAARFEVGEQQIRTSLSRLSSLIGSARFEGHLARARSVLGITPNTTTVASAVSVMISGIRLDFRRLRSDLESLPAQAHKLRTELEMPEMELPALDMEESLQRVALLEQEYSSPRPRSETPRGTFEEGFLPELTAIYQQSEQRLLQWSEVVLRPLADSIAQDQKRVEQRRESILGLEQFIRERALRLQHIAERLPSIEQDREFLRELLFRLQPVDL